MSDPADIATGAVGGATGGGLLFWLVTRLLNRGDRAEVMLAERGESAIADHKARLQALEREVAEATKHHALAERVARLEALQGVPSPEAKP